MKKKNILFETCLLGAFAFSSCEKNLYDESKQSEKEIKMTDLEIPANFPWETSKDAKCKIVSSTTSLVSIFLDSNCTQLLSTVNIDPAAPALPVVVPDYLEKAYLKYETVSAGNKVIETEVTNGMINFSLPEDAKPSVAPVVTRGGGKGDYTPQPGMEDNILEYPSGYGTVMFEDMYPQLGDYDFNDFVAWYKYQLQDFFHKGGTWYTYVMQIGFQIRALGGINDFSPYINLAGVKYDDIDEIIFQETGDGIEFIKGPNGEAILSYTNPSKPAGSKYLNTEPEYITTSGVNTSIYIYFKEPVELSRLQDKMVDIYLAKPDHGTEIHLKGYKGIYPSSQNAKYSNEDNYVWGLKAPAALNHMIEENDFIKGYPKFKDWIEGKGHKQWWVSPKNDYLILLN